MSVPKLSCPYHGIDESATWAWLDKEIRGFDNSVQLLEKWKCRDKSHNGYNRCNRRLRIRWT